MSGKQRFLVRFWGVRGSYPTPGPHTLRHGGNTSCVEVQAGKHTLIFDAGSGIIRLGEEIMRRTKDRSCALSLFITHGHGDHLIGFPFFAPLFKSSVDIHIFGPCLQGQTIEQLVTPIMSPPYFPVDIHYLPCGRAFHTITDNEHIIWRRGQTKPEVVTAQEITQETEVRVTAQFTGSHPLNGAIIYRVEYAGRCLIYATDVEWSNGHDPAFLAFAEEADMLIHDAQYTTDDYRETKHGYGHSTVEMATATAAAARVRELILFHHEPTYDDTQLDQMEAEARKHFARTRSACEGMEIDLLAPRSEEGLL